MQKWLYPVPCITGNFFWQNRNDMLWPIVAPYTSPCKLYIYWDETHTHTTYTCSNSTEPLKTVQGTKDKGLQTNCAAAISRSKHNPQDTCTKASNNKHEQTWAQRHKGHQPEQKNQLQEPTSQATDQANGTTARFMYVWPRQGTKPSSNQQLQGKNKFNQNKVGAMNRAMTRHSSWAGSTALRPITCRVTPWMA